MIKKYNGFINENLLDKMKGKTYKDILDASNGNPDLLLELSVKSNISEGIIKAIQDGANVSSLIYKRPLSEEEQRQTDEVNRYFMNLLM